MTSSVALSPVNRLWMERFTELSGHGLFAAPWTSTAAESLTEARQMADVLFHVSEREGDLAALLGHLLSVRSHCLAAAKETAPITARTRYHAALIECQAALDHLHDAADGLRADLASWALGVHTLILAQRAMPDAAQSRELARRAAEQLQSVHDPLCAGAEADRIAALTLANEPRELAPRAESLPYRILDALNQAKYDIQLHENLMNLRLVDVREQYGSAFRSGLAWIAANLALLATLPLNAVYFTAIPWSLPFLLGLFAVWWRTYAVPYRDGLYFFSWFTWRKNQALERFCEAARTLPDAGAAFAKEALTLLSDGRRDRDRLNQFYLFALAPSADTMPEAEKIHRDGQDLLKGTWMVELDDRHPWLVADLLPEAPFMVPHGTRIWYGTSEH